MNEIANKAAYYARIAQYASDGFSQVYLGAKDIAPTTDNNGNPLIVGALYFNTVSDILYVWDGAAWDIATNFNETTPFIANGTTTSRNLVTRMSDIINVKDFGAVGDGVADDTAAINAAFLYAQNKGYGSIYFPYGTYYITEGACIESPDAYDASQNIGPFSIEGYGATIKMTNAFVTSVSPINGIVKSAILIAGVTNITISGLSFQGTGTSLSTATTATRYNTADPGHKGDGIRIQGYKKAIVQDCVFNGLNLGIIINDDDPRSPLPIPPTKPIESGIYSICNNRFFANWQSLSFTYGGNSNGTIYGNYFEQTVTKLISHYGDSQTTDQLSGPSHIITNNNWKNCPSVIIGLDNCIIANNIFDTVIGGIWTNVGSDYPNTNFNYNIVNYAINNNVFTYTNKWTTASEANMVPVCSWLVGIDTIYTAGQTSLYKNINFMDNYIRTDASNSSTAGIIQLTTTNAKTVFENLNISNNEITITSNQGVFIYSEIAASDVQFNFSTKIIGNTFRRGEGATSGGTANFEFTLVNNTFIGGSTTSTLQVINNAYYGSLATNSIFNISRFAQCILSDNQLYLGESAATFAPIFRTLGCPRITANSNYVVRNGSANNGVLIGFGVVDVNDQPLMEKVRIKTSQNSMSRGAAGIYPITPFTFASGYGLIESVNDEITVDPTIQWMPAIANVDAFCVVNPTTRNLATTGGITAANALTVVPQGYSCKTRLATAGSASAYRLGSASWLNEGALS
jgi:hypothetical protein